MSTGSAAAEAERRLPDLIGDVAALDADRQPDAARALVVPALRALDSAGRAAWGTELLRAALGVEAGQLEGWLSEPEPSEDYADKLYRHLVPDEVARLRARREARRIVEAEGRDATLPALASLRDLLAAPRPEPRWTIPRWQPADSRVMLSAQFKAGKTTGVGNLLRSLADGADWLGVATVKRTAGTVALLDTEMSEGMLLDWLADQGIVADDRVAPVALRGRVGALDLLDSGRRAEWAAMLRESGVSYLVLDCLRPVLDVLGLDEHRDAGRFLVQLDALLTDAGVPDCLVVHHMGHAGERSRGDSRLRDWPDVEWRMLRQGDDADPAAPRFITAYGRDVDIPEMQLHHDPATRRLTAVGGSRREAAELEAVEAVAAAVEAAGEPLSGRQIEAATAGKVSRDLVRAALSRAIRDGRIVAEPGPRNATLHSPAPPVRECAASAPAQSASECASAPIGRAHTHSPADDDGRGSSARPRALEPEGEL